MMKQLAVVTIASFLMVACAGRGPMGNREPIVDMKGVDPVAYEQDLAECRAYTAQVNVGGRAAEGAATGAVVGGVLGAVVGNSDTAERAAGVGAVTGGASGAGRGLEERNRVLRNCLLGRGYRVLN